MLRLSRLIIVISIVCGSCISGTAQTGTHHPPPQYGQPPEDLANALVQMARASHVPLIAELVWPLPKVPTAEGVPLNPETLNDLVERTPGYGWTMEGKVVHFYNKNLRRARFNFLNLTIPQFTIPPDLSTLKLWFPGEAIGLLDGYAAQGCATTGFGDTLLEQEKLQRVVLENVSPLEILVHVANDSPNFYTLLIFPTETPTKDDAEKRVVWQWGSLNEKLQPVYAQPPKNRQMAHPQP